MASPGFMQQITAIVGEKNASSDEAILHLYGADVSDVEGHPDIVVRPSTTEEVAKIVTACAKASIPVIPRGGGTGATGGAVAISGGVLVDLTRMTDIIELDLDNLQVRVQAGIVIDRLNEYLAPTGFYYVVTPGSSAMATVGGAVANDASGMRACKHGTAKDHLLAMTVVQPDGSVVNIGGKVLKDVAGLDLLRLYAGSEGTLGIITEIGLKLTPRPQSRGVLVAYFDDLHHAGQAVINTLKAGIVPSALELLDKSSLIAISKHKPDLDIHLAEAMLLFELEGGKAEVKQQLDAVSELLTSMGVEKKDFSLDGKRIEELWEARKVVGAAASTLKEGYNRVYEGEDICVPLSRIPETLLKIRELVEKHGLGLLLFGHVSIGSIHPAITIRKTSENDRAAVKQLADEIHSFALSVGGTVTGEHGIGVARKKYMKLQKPGEYGIMKKIKKALDPGNIMNPGKVFD